MSDPMQEPKTDEQKRKEREELNRRIEKFWPSSDGYNDSREDVDEFNRRKGGGVW